jgi:transcription elongation factor/antiterminator RfaH
MGYDFRTGAIATADAMSTLEAHRTGERWFVVNTQPHCERRAQAHLNNQAFTTFLPRRVKTVRHARRLVTGIAALFPQYLFVSLNLERHQWRTINGTIGVKSLLMQGEKPNLVPHGIVEDLIAATDSHGIFHPGNRGLKVGGSVRLLAGPFAEQLAVLESLDEQGRVRVLLNMLGRKVTVSTSSACVLPMGDVSRTTEATQGRYAF